MRAQDRVSATKAADKGFEPFSHLGGRGLASAKNGRTGPCHMIMKVFEVLSGWYLAATVSWGKTRSPVSSSGPAHFDPTRASATSRSWTTTSSSSAATSSTRKSTSTTLTTSYRTRASRCAGSCAWDTASSTRSAGLRRPSTCWTSRTRPPASESSARARPCACAWSGSAVRRPSCYGLPRSRSRADARSAAGPSRYG